MRPALLLLALLASGCYDHPTGPPTFGVSVATEHDPALTDQDPRPPTQPPPGAAARGILVRALFGNGTSIVVELPDGTGVVPVRQDATPTTLLLTVDGGEPHPGCRYMGDDGARLQVTGDARVTLRYGVRCAQA